MHSRVLRSARCLFATFYQDTLQFLFESSRIHQVIILVYIDYYILVYRHYFYIMSLTN